MRVRVYKPLLFIPKWGCHYQYEYNLWVSVPDDWVDELEHRIRRKNGKHAESGVLFGQQAFAGNNEIFERYRAA